eukprot:scaffold18712_cov118-Isochrysis_galbana.AAC.2
MTTVRIVSAKRALIFWRPVILLLCIVRPGPPTAPRECPSSVQRLSEWAPRSSKTAARMERRTADSRIETFKVVSATACPLRVINR